MKVVHVFDGYGIPNARALPGGKNGSVATVVYHLAKNMALKGLDVTVLERDNATLPSEEYLDGVRYLRIKAKSLSSHPYRLIQTPLGLSQLFVDGYFIAKKLDKYLSSIDCDIIHLHFPVASSFLVNINKKIRYKCIYTLHAGEIRLGLNKESPFILKLFSPDIYLIKRVKKSVLLNECLRDKLIEKNISSSKLEVVPNGISIDELDKYSRKLNYYKNPYFNILFVGKIIPRKGVEYLIKAIKKIVEYGATDFKLTVVGDTKLDPTFYGRLLSFVKKNNLSKFIEFKNFVSYNELLKLYSLCDVFVLPSLEEGFGMVLTEALCFGKPVIGTKVGGIPMQILDGWNGFLVEPGDDQELAERILYFLQNAYDRKRMGKNSRKLAEEFDWKKIVDRYISIYEKVMDDGY